MNRADKRAVAKSIKKAKPIKLAEVKEKSAEIPKDLSDKWAIVEQIATTHSILQKVTFTMALANHVNNSLTFLMKFHESCIEDLLTHPDAHLIPQLKEELDKRAKAKADEKTN